MPNPILAVLGLVVSTIAALGLAWIEPLPVLFGNLEGRVDREFRMIYQQIPAGEPSREWKRNRLNELKQGRIRGAFWIAVLLVGILLSIAGAL